MWGAIVAIYNAVFFRPLFNGLLFLVDILPGGDLGFAIIIVTLLIRFVLFPFQHRMLQTQHAMRRIEPEIKKIREQAKNKEEEARHLLALYQEHGINPFASFLLLFIQLPLLIAIFHITQGLVVDGQVVIQSSLLYPFMKAPGTMQTVFLGIFTLTKVSYVLAGLAAVTQLIQARLAMVKPPVQGASPQSDFQRALQQQMVYVFPIVVFIIAIRFPGTLALYWTTTNVFGIVHEVIVRRKAHLPPSS